EMREDAIRLQAQLVEILHEQLEYPVEWVKVIDDTKGNSDHFNFIQAGYASVWIRGMHEYIIEEGDTCEQTIKHAQTDTLLTLRTYAGGREELENGFQTALDALALFAWWDMNVSHGLGPSQYSEDSILAGGINLGWILFFLVPIIAVPVIWASRIEKPKTFNTEQVLEAELLD
ncbi:MAG: hypothetical protein HOA04_00220, partial [Euryarchaeota archaeon]|nr:hypothetical protein [Euryarchaeota archaeon]